MSLLFLTLFVGYAISSDQRTNQDALLDINPSEQTQNEVQSLNVAASLRQGSERVRQRITQRFSCFSHLLKNLYDSFCPTLELDWANDSDLVRARGVENTQKKFKVQLHVRIEDADDKPEQKAMIVFENGLPRLLIHGSLPRDDVEFIKIAPELPIIKDFLMLWSILTIIGVSLDQIYFDKLFNFPLPKAGGILTIVGLLAGCVWQKSQSKKQGRLINYPTQYQLKMRNEENPILFHLIDENKKEFYEQVVFCEKYQRTAFNDRDVEQSRLATASRMFRKFLEVLVEFGLYTALWIGLEKEAEAISIGKNVTLSKSLGAFLAYVIFALIGHFPKKWIVKCWNIGWSRNNTWTTSAPPTAEAMKVKLNQFQFETENSQEKFVEVPMVYYNENSHRNATRKGLLVLRKDGAPRCSFRFQNGVEHPIEDPQGADPRFIDTWMCGPGRGQGWYAFSIKVGSERFNIRPEGDLFCSLILNKLSHYLQVRPTTTRRLKWQRTGILTVLVAEGFRWMLFFLAYLGSEMILQFSNFNNLSPLLRSVGGSALAWIIITFVNWVTNCCCGWKEDWEDPDLPEYSGRLAEGTTAPGTP